jgi:hypothetical protein
MDKSSRANLSSFAKLRDHQYAMRAYCVALLPLIDPATTIYQVFLSAPADDVDCA